MDCGPIGVPLAPRKRTPRCGGPAGGRKATAGARSDVWRVNHWTQCGTQEPPCCRAAALQSSNRHRASPQLRFRPAPAAVDASCKGRMLWLTSQDSEWVISRRKPMGSKLNNRRELLKGGALAVGAAAAGVAATRAFGQATFAPG